MSVSHFAKWGANGCDTSWDSCTDGAKKKKKKAEKTKNKNAFIVFSLGKCQKITCYCYC